MISIKQEINGEWVAIENFKEFWTNVGIFSPFVVDTREEADYMFAMQLMVGKEFLTLVDGVDENPTKLPPTYLKIDLPPVES